MLTQSTLQDELDRREQEIADLRAANDDLSQTVETLKAELIQSHADAESLHNEMEKLRSRAFDTEQASTDEAQQREIALRETQEDLERVRIERDEWEGEAMRERVRREELAARQGQIEMDLAQAKADRETLREERDREMESAANLNAVLEEFQASAFVLETEPPRALVVDSLHPQTRIANCRASSATSRISCTRRSARLRLIGNEQTRLKRDCTVHTTTRSGSSICLKRLRRRTF